VLYAETVRHAQALEPLFQAHKIRQSLADAHLDLTEPRADLAQSLQTLGYVHVELGHGDEGLGWLEQARTVQEGLARIEPGITLHRRELARTWTLIGLAHRRAGRLAEALKSHEQARALLEVLIRQDGEDLDSRSLLGQSWNNSGYALAQFKRYESAIAAYGEAVGHQRAAFDRAPHVVQFRKELGHAHANLSEALLAVRRPTEAAAAALEIRRLWPRDARELYGVARLLAACAAPLGAGKAEGRRGDTEPAEGLVHLEAAMETLRQAIEAGFRDAALLSRDASLTSVHSRPDFQAMVMDLAFPPDPFRR
jgi:tetratricopeptide (TPR) repeat protein